MWISKQLYRRYGTPPVQKDTVVSAGTAVRVKNAAQNRENEVVLPYGVYSVIPTGQTALLLGQDGICVGVLQSVTGLMPGEVCLYSLGGAKIVLKNSGEVEINGQIFAAQTQGEGS